MNSATSEETKETHGFSGFLPLTANQRTWPNLTDPALLVNKQIQRLLSACRLWLWVSKNLASIRRLL